LIKNNLKTPFIFGKIATDKDFTDRKTEIERLVSNFISSVNIVLISPRRWGKSSLVEKAAAITLQKNKKLRFCFIDLNNIRTEEQFYQYLATQVLKASAKKLKVIIDNARQFLGRFIPTITLSPGPDTEFRLGLDWKEVKKQPDEILDLAEKIGAKNNIEFIICIDEFQNISGFEKPVEIQKKMRSHWQKHKNVSYCIYGSKRHMMTDIFTSPSMPFYKFGDVLFIEKISMNDWIIFIQKRFQETGKKIGRTEAGLIPELTDCHSYYVQQLAQQSWLRTKVICDTEIITVAFDDLMLQLSMLFQNLIDGLSNTQVNFLKALINGVEQLSSQQTIQDYHLGTSANVVKIKKMLINNEIIDLSGDKIFFLDPLFKAWLKKYFFNL
jgi:hypothetical protein